MTDSAQCPTCGRQIPPDTPGGLCPYCLMRLGMPDRDSPGHGAAADRNLLFGVVAVQAGFVQPADFFAAAESWLADPKESIADRLIASGLLERAQRDAVDRLVEETGAPQGDAMEPTLGVLDEDGTIAGGFSGVSWLEEARDASTELRRPLGLDPADSDDESLVVESPGRYTRKSEHSRGGMGRILLVHDEYLARDVALKELMPHSDAGDAAVPTPARATASLVARFLREAKVTGQLEHPSIVPVYELGRRPDGTRYYTMKLVRGQTLAQALRQVKTLPERLSFLSHYLDLCQAIGYAHSRNVIHRDIKPANVMIGEFGETVVIDWGLAKAVGQTDIHETELRDLWTSLVSEPGADPSKTAPGTLLGTPQYMSPEQARGEIDAIDQRTDVFALGIVLYLMLAGRPPFRGKTTRAVFAKVIEANPPPIADIAPGAPPELVSICRKAMAREPKDRYPSAKELSADVQNFLTGAVVQAYSYSPGEVLLRFYRRHKTLINATAAALFAIVVIAAVSYTRVVRERDRALRAEALATEAQGQAERDRYVAEVRLAQMHMDENEYASANSVLWGIEPTQRGWEWGLLLNLCNQARYSIEPSTYASYSPQLGVIAHFVPSQPLYLSDAATGERIRTMHETPPRLSATVFHPQRAELTAALWDGQIRTWDTATGQELWTVRLTSDRVDGVAYSGDGAVLAALGGRGDGAVWATAGGAPDEVARFVFGGVGSYSVDDTLPPVRSGDLIQLDADGTRLLLMLGNIPLSEGAFALYSLGPDGADLQGEAVGYAPRFRPGSTELVAAVGDTLVIFETSDGALAVAAELTGHVAPIVDVRVATDGALAITASEDGSARVWDLVTRELRHELRPGYGDAPMHLAVLSPDGAFAATANAAMRLHVWDMNSGLQINELRGHQRPPQWLAFNAQRDRLVSSDFESVKAWNAGEALGFGTPVHALATVSDIDVAHDGSRLVYGESGARAGVVALDGARAVFTVAASNPANPAPVAIAPDGARFVAALDGFMPVVFDVQSREVVTRYEGHNGVIEALAYMPDGERIVSAGRDRTAHVWRAADGETELVLDGHDSRVSAVAASRDGRVIATGTVLGTVTVWNADNGTLRWSIPAHQGPINRLTFDSGNTRIVATSDDRTVSVWNLEDGVLAERLATHNAATTGVVLSDELERIFSGSTGGDIRVARSPDFAELAVLRGHAGRVNDLAWTPERRLYSADYENAVHRWDAFPARMPNGAPATREAFETFRAARMNATPPAPAFDAPFERVLTTADIARAALSELLEIVRPLESLPGNGIAASTPENRGALARLKAESGDLIVELGDTNVSAGDAFEAAIDAAVASLDGPDEPTIAYSLRRRGTDVRVELELLPVVREDHNVPLQYADAVRFLQEWRDEAREYEANYIRLNALVAEALGEPAEAPSGMTVNVRPNTNAEDRLHALGLANYDRIVVIDGQPLTSVDTLAEGIDAALRRLSDEPDTEIVFDVKRGLFRLLRVHLNVTR